MRFQWPVAARSAIAIFFSKWNDIDVFVEDTAGHADSVYRALINRLLKGNAHVERVISLGPRDKVISACQSDTLTTGKPRIYLIDGDLDLLIGRREAPLPRLFQHYVYAIENYLLSEDALVEILHEENPRFKKETIKNKLDYENWLISLADLYRLFVVFAISKELAPELPTISLGISLFISGNKTPRLDPIKIGAFCNHRKIEILLKVSTQKFARTESLIQHRLNSVSDPLDFLAARDFVFPLLLFWIKAIGLALKANKETLQFRLAKVIPLDRYKEFANQVELTANGGY